MYIHWSGYLLLILLALLAPTPIPIPLDGIIIGLIVAGYNPALVLVLALIGDLAGTYLIYKIGYRGGETIEEYERKKHRRDYVWAANLHHRFGRYSLLLDGVPFLGDALIFLAGIFKMPLRDFAIFFSLGKLLWYGFLALSLLMVSTFHLR